ncbi:cyclin-L1-like [Ptychodera flava]|uniref:cyclin-L1-like n=1 Tax=Ptychodera flava TaxID=63121 RepID=UPI00396A2C09
MAETGQRAEKTYGKVIINLENCILPHEKVSLTPSTIDGLDKETEIDLRIIGCEFIQTAGILLKLPQVAMATAQVIFQRFYYSKSMVKHNMETLAMACINLASKIEEAPRRVRDVINVFHHIRQKRNNRTPNPLVLDQNYINLKNSVIKAERRVLKELGFCVHVKHPHKMIVTYLQILECERNLKLVQTAWNYMNDSLRTNVFVCYNPETIACACIYLSARQLKLPLPNRPPWYTLLGATEDDMTEISLTILQLYARPKKCYEELDKIVEKCRVKMQQEKLKAKGEAAGTKSTGATPSAGFSPASRPSSPKASGSTSPHNKLLKKKLKDEGGGNSAGSVGSRERNGRDHGDRSRSRTPRSRESRSGTPQHNSHSHSRSPSHHSSSHSSDRYSRSLSNSPRKGRSRYDSPRRHKRHDDHRSKDRDHISRSKHTSSHSRKRKHSRSYSRSRSRSRSRTPRAYKHRRSSPHSRDRHRHRYSRSRSKERVHKSSKRDRMRSDGHRSRDRHRR